MTKHFNAMSRFLRLILAIALLAGCARGYSTATVGQLSSEEVAQNSKSQVMIDWGRSIAQTIVAKYGRLPLYRTAASEDGVLVAPVDQNHMIGTFTTSSGWPEFDQAYLNAANSSGPFPPCPDASLRLVRQRFAYKPAS